MATGYPGEVGIVAKTLSGGLERGYKDDPQKTMTILAQAMFTGNLKELKKVYNEKGPGGVISTSLGMFQLPGKTELKTLVNWSVFDEGRGRTPEEHFSNMAVIRPFITGAWYNMVSKDLLISALGTQLAALVKDSVNFWSGWSEKVSTAADHEFCHFLMFNFWEKYGFKGELSRRWRKATYPVPTKSGT